MRHHRTATTSLAVAALLVVIGSLVGSILWNQSRAREFAAKSETLSKALELELNAQRRIAELTASTEAAEELAENEIRRDRYSSALEILRGAREPIQSEPAVREAYERVRDKASRLEKIVEFYRLADYVHEQNVLSRDTKALLASTAALKTLGAWEPLDWWTALPDDDLAPEQIDALRWEVYRQWVLMDAMLIKQIGVQLIGDDAMDATAVIRAATRMLTTEIGKPKAEAALRVSDRIERFRFSEAAKFYRSVARTRLGGSPWIKGNELGIPQNSADGHSLGVLCMIAALDPGFEVFFRDYQGDDALLSARFAFRQAASMQADHYWTQLALAQIEFLIAQRKDHASWEDYEPAAQILSHCISLSPDKCFAHSDRSTVYRIQARLIQNDERYSADERQRRAVRFLRWSLEDSRRATQWVDEQPWVGWPTAMIYADSGKTDDAINLLIETSFRTYPFVDIGDATLLKVDDLRGRAEAADWLVKQREHSNPTAPDRTPLLVALAAIRLNQFRFSDAAEAADLALANDEQSIGALAVRAMVRLHTEQFDQARIDFQTVHATDARHPWATFGLAACDEADGKFASALQWYRDAVSLAASDENRAAAALGQSRCAALLGQFPLAETSIRQAIAYEPACDIMSVVWPLGDQLVQLKKAPDAAANEGRVRDLIAFLKVVQSLPRATKAEAIPTQPTGKTIEASLLNGDFELGMKYWDTSITPDNTGRHDTQQSDVPFVVSISDEQSHGGSASLAIRGGASKRIALSTLVTQTLTVELGKQYRIRCWAKASNLAPQSIVLRSSDNAALLEFAPGSYDWTPVETVWKASSKDSPRTLVRQSIELAGQSTASTETGTLWLDDLTITRVE